MTHTGGPSPSSADGGSPHPAPSSAVVRRVLLGVEGPCADPREALDALDNVETWVAQLDVDGSVALAEVLLALAADPDVVVATGAVLALDVVRRRHGPSAGRFAATVEQMIDLVLTGNAALDRPPEGFGRASQATLRAELAVVAARAASTDVARAVSTLVERAPSIGARRADVVAGLAESLPALVVARARDWVGPHDSAVVARLAEHHRRLAVATAVRPWGDDAIEAIELAGQWQRWHEAEIEALVRVMRDDAPELTAPTGVGDVDLRGRWWIVAEQPWDWTLWRGDDGRAVLERVEGGVGMWTSVRAVTEEAAAAIVSATVDGVALTGRQIVASLVPDA